MAVAAETAVILIALSADSAVKVDYDIDASLARLLYNPVKAREIELTVGGALPCAVIVGLQIPVPERNSDAVEAHICDYIHIVFGEPVILIEGDKPLGLLGAETVGEGRENVILPIGVAGGADPFLLDQPAADIGASENDLFAALIKEFLTLDGDEILIGYRGSGVHRRIAVCNGGVRRSSAVIRKNIENAAGYDYGCDEGEGNDSGKDFLIHDFLRILMFRHIILSQK